MTISYNWLHEYLPLKVDAAKLSQMLTAVGLEVEGMENYESIKGGLNGLVVGEVLECQKHPNADKLSLTKVNIGGANPLSIVCGAPNVAKGQKVIVAPVGTTIYPVKGEPITMKLAKIRGEESQGMICSADEIGLGNDHAGIVVLKADATVGAPVAGYFSNYSDIIYEIGLTPNRMDAMSHLGVAKDVCAYISHHEGKIAKLKSPFSNGFSAPDNKLPISVTIKNTEGCRRYAGVSLMGVQVKESPHWLQDRLKAIGQRPINNIVDVTNFILHETGQPLHAFDADKIKGRKIIVQNLPEGSVFLSLDEKERKLSAEDLIICNGDNEGMCIAGVFGGLQSGVTNATTNIFLESAWFNPVDIRKTSFRHGLRTDAAMRFEKNVDISNTVNVLKRAAILILEVAGGTIASELIDIYPKPAVKNAVTLTYQYLEKLSGKNYPTDSVIKILVSLGFDILKEGKDDITVAAPLNKPDISLPADVVEEIMRIDGLDAIDIPTSITITPSTEALGYAHTWKEKISNYLVGLGFHEIFTNSITNAAYYDEADLQKTVRLLNNLSVEHNIMRPSMLETGLEAVAHNLNRKNINLKFFEFGKIYANEGGGKFTEVNQLCLYVTGNAGNNSWKGKAQIADTFYLKGVLQRLVALSGIENTRWTDEQPGKIINCQSLKAGMTELLQTGIASTPELKRFDIKQPVYYAAINWDEWLKEVNQITIIAKELPRQLPVYRDLAMIVPRDLRYAQVENTVKKLSVEKLQAIELFDIFESEKMGAGKKSLALSFTFLDEEKTLTDKEIDGMMGRIMTALEQELKAEIRKQ